MITLPIDSHKSEFTELLTQHPGVIISAPPGTGKSTRIPLFAKEWNSDAFSKDSQCVMVLQPRRLAAISLATRVSQETKTTLGQEIGYRVRGDQATSPKSEIQFQTYGHFFEEIKSKPHLPHVSVLILDEFHERQVEMDLIWAWVHYLKEHDLPIPKIILMSATLDEGSMSHEIADWGRLSIDMKMHPIETSYLKVSPSEKLNIQVGRAVKTWIREKNGLLQGTCLCFLPGWGEIQQAKQHLEEDILYGQDEVHVEVLHGSLKLSEQNHVCRDTDDVRIILTTNIAETSITIPGITCVIDSGWEREASWNPEKGTNSLGLKRITLQSAEQRRGRAGRTGPGSCIRLWEEKWEQDWDNFWRSQLVKQEWTRSLLGMLQLLKSNDESSPIDALNAIPWLTPPNEAILKTSLAVLKETECIDSKGIPLPGGDWVLSVPVQPRLARILYLAQGARFYKISAAMISILESGGNTRSKTGNLLEEGMEFLDSSKHSKEVKELFHALCKKEKSIKPSREYDSLEDIWCDVLEDQIAVLTQSKRYQLPSGFIGELMQNVQTENTPAILALDMWESFRKGNKTSTIRQYIPLSNSFWKSFTERHQETVFRCTWIAQGKKVSVLKENSYRGTVFSSEKAAEAEYPDDLIANFIVDQIQTGEIDSPIHHEDFTPHLYRYNLLCKAYPEYEFSEITADDFELMLFEWVGDKKSQKDLELPKFIQIFLDYIPFEAQGLMESQLPRTLTLPTGKKAKITYFEDAPPELSARITDFAGMQGTYSLCDGRIEVLYNLLAPNYRTAQKTMDLTEFWTNSYPEIKKELRGRYPKHPWP